MANIFFYYYLFSLRLFQPNHSLFCSLNLNTLFTKWKQNLIRFLEMATKILAKQDQNLKTCFAKTCHLGNEKRERNGREFGITRFIIWRYFEDFIILRSLPKLAIFPFFRNFFILETVRDRVKWTEILVHKGSKMNSTILKFDNFSKILRHF